VAPLRARGSTRGIPACCLTREGKCAPGIVLRSAVVFDHTQDKLKGVRLHALPAVEGVVEDGDHIKDQTDGRGVSPATATVCNQDLSIPKR
jgi:hypothetical protein